MPRGASAPETKPRSPTRVTGAASIFKTDGMAAARRRSMSESKYKPAMRPDRLAGGKVATVEASNGGAARHPDPGKRPDQRRGRRSLVFEIVQTDLISSGKGQERQASGGQQAGRQYAMRFNVLFKPGPTLPTPPSTTPGAPGRGSMAGRRRRFSTPMSRRDLLEG